MTRSKAIQLGVGVGLVGAWLILRAVNPEWAMWVFAPWVEMRRDFGWWVPAVGGGLLVATLGSFLWSLYGPRKQHHPEDAMALGCVSMASFGVGGVMLVFLMAVIFRWIGVVNMISFTMMILAALILPQYYWAKAQDWRKAQARREKWVRPEELKRFLGGKTHVIDRESTEPARRWRELRYYAADGTMRGYEEVEGKLTPFPGKLAWRAGKSELEIEDLEKRKVFRYVVMRRWDGQVSYYLVEGETNVTLAFRTVEVREGEPPV